MNNPFFGTSIIDRINEAKCPLPVNFIKLSKKELRKEYLFLRSQYISNNEAEHIVHLRFQEMGQEILELREALDRRRQLYKTMEDLVNRGQPKSIEDMADSLLMVLANEEGNCRAQWSDMNQEAKDRIIEKLMQVIS